MHKDKALAHIKADLSEQEELVGFFSAIKPFKIWLFILIGPLAVLSMKSYLIAVTTKGVNFYRLNMLGKLARNDFFTFDEIESVKIGKGWMQTPMKYQFASGRKLKIKAQKKGADRVATINDETMSFIQQNIKQAA